MRKDIPFDRVWLHSRRKQAEALAVKMHRSSTLRCALAFLPKACERSCYEQRGKGLACAPCTSLYDFMCGACLSYLNCDIFMPKEILYDENRKTF